MSRYDLGSDDPRVRIRPGKGSRPRSKRRPDYSSSPQGRVVGIDRGRFAVALDDSQKTVTAVKAREIPRSAVVIGDLVRLTGDISGKEGTLARIARVEPRHNVLRRSLEESATGRGEKIIVANADLMLIVTAAADPPPRTGMVDRCLVAAKEAGIPAVLCVTKTDLADPSKFLKNFADFDLTTVLTMEKDGEVEGSDQVLELTKGKFSVLVGHSGVGKSTLINALAPGADRAVGDVNVHTGKGRHTSTSAVAKQLPPGGWVVDTPGVRSFGLQHAQTRHVLEAFPGLEAAAAMCLPNCSHAANEPSCALTKWAQEGQDGEQRDQVLDRARRLLEGVQETPT